MIFEVISEGMKGNAMILTISCDFEMSIIVWVRRKCYQSRGATDSRFKVPF